ncbi:Putative uncharacterized protein [Lactobacillus hominis DSM 23910 = CRBIP 24.179]|uniref:Uncharacterized protein n=1 Tax=Lactobacillus hominis DSM 23910 = CRBIP 24.179 TaxID=1423758 RepID=I7JV26_9LACO|nr:Putative uncharacterized protein [Lactobacillus hominis DSM 23910 = CRBIP 24.179]
MKRIVIFPFAMIFIALLISLVFPKYFVFNSNTIISLCIGIGCYWLALLINKLKK